MTPKEFMSRLEAISKDDGQLYGRLRPLYQAQENYAGSSQSCKGFMALSAAWKCFFLETVERVNSDIISKISSPPSESYPLFVERLGQYFQGLCASEVVAIAGYPLQAYTLLRNVFDSVILTAAVTEGKTDFLRLEGLDAAGQFDPLAFRKLRRKEENAVRPQMTGKQSGLSETTLDELSKWDVLFDDETHGGLLSRAYSADWLRGKQRLPILPRFEEMPFGNFMNRYCEIAWMVHRLLPLVQFSSHSLAEEWKGKWKTIDECFYSTADALAVQNGKAIGRAIIELVTTKLPFDENSTFWR